MEKKYPPKKAEPPPTDDSVVTPMSAAVTYGNLLFNDYKSEALATQVMYLCKNVNDTPFFTTKQNDMMT